MEPTITPLSESVGAKISGVDVSGTLNDEHRRLIRDALAQHGVIVLHNQKLVPEQQVAFTRVFGEPEINYNAKRFGIDGSPEIYIISNITENDEPIGTRRAGECWHTDMSYAERPAKATMLYAIEVPTLHGFTLGDTQFANAAAAWESLPQSMQEEICDLRCIFDFRARKRGRPPSEEGIAKYPPVEHPVVRTHPLTGRKSLYIARDCTEIVGYDEEAGQALIGALINHIVRPEFVYRHRWRVGDVVVWDNCTVQHQAVLDYDLPQRRLMWRTTVKGDAPI